MPVTVQCNQCSNVLELDEGFRGGVCRCAQCGTLLHVPKAPKTQGPATPRPARPAAPTPVPGQKRTPSGVDMGISSGGLSPQNMPKAHQKNTATTTPPPKPTHRPYLWILCLVLMILVIVVAVVAAETVGL